MSWSAAFNACAGPDEGLGGGRKRIFFCHECGVVAESSCEWIHVGHWDREDFCGFCVCRIHHTHSHTHTHARAC